ncbi:hypothetical protein [Xanthomonas arboricola]|uniref:Uncharacterized protein n=4 Tax=Xanthomonas arboricola pv. pruni TaxID=69929 RepID=W4SDN3_9XANT|nr:hypothetical protein XPU_0168 [Xanthomonas arboricola pv. pruni str. MAFF 311562]GAE54303.1 hypothetical protein XPR_0938 [Xanthomonas arboricola pv. pruni MAFF 301420]GAE59059.1 hypothetical protein XPN_0965 [Xanthomonas arboricola pv. pruni MAFF 301427]
MADFYRYQENTMLNSSIEDEPYGQLALIHLGKLLQLQVLKSAAGYYLGTVDVDGDPVSRESVEYFPTSDAAAAALISGQWRQLSYL